MAQANHCIDIDYASIDKGLSDLELRFSGNDQKMLWKISVKVEHLIKKASPAFTKFYKMDGEILEAEEKIYASFRRERGLGYMTVAEILETMHENDQFDMFRVFSNVLHILGVTPATFCSAERSFSALCRLKTYLRSTMGQRPVSNIVSNMIVSLLSLAVKMAKTAISFNVFYELI